jgi:hypothetical protein
MMEQFGAYLVSKPKRAVQIVLALVVALIVTIAGTLIVAFDLGQPSEPPYPSDATPLSIVDEGVMWTRDFNDLGSGGLEPSYYSMFRCCWMYEYSSGSTSRTGDLVNEEDLAELNMSVSAVVQTPFGGRTPWFDAPNLTIIFSIHDVTGDGIFGVGDFIVMDDAPRTEGIVYTWALAWIGVGVTSQEFSYAFQDGVFYSWRSSVLPTEGPWWGT